MNHEQLKKIFEKTREGKEMGFFKEKDIDRLNQERESTIEYTYQIKNLEKNTEEMFTAINHKLDSLIFRLVCLEEDFKKLKEQKKKTKKDEDYY